MMVCILADLHVLGGSFPLGPRMQVLPVPLQPPHEAADDGQAGFLGARNGAWLWLWLWWFLRKVQRVVDNGEIRRLQENTGLLSVFGLTGTPQRVSLLGLGGKGCSFGVHSVNAEDVGLRLTLLAESQLVVCVISAAYFSTALDCTSSP